MEPTLQQAILLIKSGRRDAARTQLARLLRQDPANARAWLWLATVTEDPQRRRFCVQQAVDRDPADPQARRLWEQLFRQTLPPAPAPAAQVAPQPVAPHPADAQPLQPAIGGNKVARRPATGRWRLRALRLTGVLAVLLGALALFLGLVTLRAQGWLGTDSIESQGEVVSLDSTVGSAFGRRYTVSYRFSTDDRLTVGQATLPRAVWDDLARGDTVTVRFDSSDPDRSQLRVGTLGLGPYLPGLGQVALGLLLLGAGLLAARPRRSS